jgi:outer membrane protein assembly factor BamB
MTSPSATARTRIGTAGALGSIAVITVVTLAIMAFVLTRDPATDTGRRTSGGSGADTAAESSTTTSTTQPKPGLVTPLPDLDEINGWTTDINVANGGTCAGPTLQGDVIAIFCDTRHMVGFDVTSGEQKWDTKTDDDVQTFIAAPTAAGSHHFVYPRGNEVVAVDAATGEVAWRVERDGVILGLTASPTHVFVMGGGRATALDPESGAVQWETPFIEGVYTQGPIQIDASSTDLIVSVGTGIQSLNVDTGEMHWTAKLGPSDIQMLKGTPTSVYVIVASGTVTALDAATGGTQWEQKDLFARNQQMISGIDNDTIYVSSTDEIGALSRADGSKRWSFKSVDDLKQPEAIDRSVFEDGHLITRGQGMVWDVDPKTGVVKAGKRMSTATPGRVRGKQLYILQATFGGGASWRLLSLGL